MKVVYESSTIPKSLVSFFFSAQAGSSADTEQSTQLDGIVFEA